MLLAERALYSLECVFHPVFSLTSGACRLDYRRPENRWASSHSSPFISWSFTLRVHVSIRLTLAWALAIESL